MTAFFKTEITGKVLKRELNTLNITLSFEDYRDSFSKVFGIGKQLNTTRVF